MCDQQMVRRAPDGRQSLFDLIADLTKTGTSSANKMYNRQVARGILPQYERLSIKGGSTPFVTDDEWAFVRSHLPCDAYLAKCFEPEDLYVMQYSNSNTTVKIGRSRNIEDRRRHLEKGHNFYMMLAAAFPLLGYLEPVVHERLAAFRSHTGAGKEWFNLTTDQAISMIQWVIDNREVSPSFSVVEVLPD